MAWHKSRRGSRHARGKSLDPCSNPLAFSEEQPIRTLLAVIWRRRGSLGSICQASPFRNHELTRSQTTVSATIDSTERAGPHENRNRHF